MISDMHTPFSETSLLDAHELSLTRGISLLMFALFLHTQNTVMAAAMIRARTNAEIPPMMAGDGALSSSFGPVLSWVLFSPGMYAHI